MTNKTREYRSKPKNTVYLPLIDWFNKQGESLTLEAQFSLDPLLSKIEHQEAAKGYKMLLDAFQEGDSQQKKTLLSLLFPALFTKKQVALLSSPLIAKEFFATTTLNQMLENKWEIELDQPELENFNDYLVAEVILRSCYNEEPDFVKNLVVRLKHNTSSLTKYFNLFTDTEYIKASIDDTSTVPKPVFNTKQSFSNWVKSFKDYKISLNGFIITNFSDVTQQELLRQLEAFMVTDESNVDYSEGLNYVQNIARSYFEINDLDFGSVYVKHVLWRQLTDWPLLRKFNGDAYLDAFEMATASYAKAISTKQPVLIQSLKQKKINTGLERHLQEMGYHGLLIAPVVNSEGEVLGLIEMASKSPFIKEKFTNLSAFLDIFSMGMNSFVQEIDQQVSLVIQQEFTAIHPSVQWKFRKTALDFYWAKTTGQQRKKIDPIQFQNVLPFYAQIDVIGSTRLRIDCTVNDLKNNLDLLLNLLGSLEKELKVNLIGLYKTKLIRAQQTLENADFTPIQEASIVSLIQQDIHNFLKELDAKQLQNAKIAKYFSRLDPEKELVYSARTAFQKSIDMLNELLSTRLNTADEEMQTMVPHYFEKSITDGVEFSLFLGSSILEEGELDTFMIKDFRFWQLLTLCRLTKLITQTRKELPIPLETSQLLFAFDNKINIEFRTDEKRFDIFGPESIKYETLKKRIEKATVVDSDERLTQKNKIAIVYMNGETRLEYLEYIKSLQFENVLSTQIEDLELAPLQDITGLRALRITLA